VADPRDYPEAVRALLVAAKLGLKARLVQESWVDWPDSVNDRVGNILLSRIMGAGMIAGFAGQGRPRRVIGIDASARIAGTRAGRHLEDLEVAGNVLPLAGHQRGQGRGKQP
jgi:1-aminocyclopropane-1-carboxylate deaminase/D-cysteine desulfhydrase-like pyridoxal-dependent ACC family enzyme